MRISRLPLFLAVFLAGVGAANAQETTGTITGRVDDAQGLAIPGATITVTGPQGSKVVTTDAEGRFSATFLTPGRYDVRAELQGFRTVQRESVTVALGQTVDIPVKTEIGFITELVEVVGTSDVINTRTTTTGANITSGLLQQVPVGRHLAAATYLAWRPA